MFVIFCQVLFFGSTMMDVFWELSVQFVFILDDVCLRSCRWGGWGGGGGGEIVSGRGRGDQ